MKTYYVYPLLFVFLLTTVWACTIQRNPVSGSQRAFAYSWEQEKQIGAEADEEISRAFGVYDDPDVANYVTQIGEEILANSHMRREDTDEQFRETEFTFRILDSPVINAFALPGGYVYMTRGLMVHLNNEAQFAVIMGHEIGHVAARHASQRALTQTLGQVATIGGAIIGQEVFGLPGESILNLSSTAAQLLFLSHSRDHERESDRLGVEYSAMSGYVAAEGAAFFTSLQRIAEEAGQDGIPNFLSTHPNPGERENEIPRLAEEWEEQGYEQTTLNEETYMEMIDGMIYGENPRDGFAENNMFYHPDLHFQFPIPQGWSVINEPSRVVLISPEEDAISMLMIDDQSPSPRRSVNAVTDDESVNLIRESSTQSSGEWDAWHATASASIEGNTLGLHIYALEYDDRIYRFINYTPEERFNNYETEFMEITRSFDELTDSEILNIEPVRIETIRADRSGSFSSFLPDNLPMDISVMDLAILNQVDPDEQIEEGRWLKIPTQ